LRTLINLNATYAQKAHRQFYKTQLLLLLIRLLQLETDRFKDRGGHKFHGHSSGTPPALQIPSTTDFQKTPDCG
jgi:hypothetical protein